MDLKKIKTLTDRELAQLRRGSKCGADGLYEVVCEQYRRGLLRKPRFFEPGDTGNPAKDIGFYWPEKLKRISDYPEGKKSRRVNKL